MRCREKTQSILRLIILSQEHLRFFIIQMIILISFSFFQVSVELMYLSQSQKYLL